MAEMWRRMEGGLNVGSPSSIGGKREGNEWMHVVLELETERRVREGC